jgi:histidinol-phosphate aminotransferase
MPVAQRPQPRPGVLTIDPCAGQARPGVARVQALVERDAARPDLEGDRRHSVAEHLEDYPDGSSTALREAIGQAFGLDPDRIVLRRGLDDLLNLIADAYLCDGDEAIHTTHGFLVYPIATPGLAPPIVAARRTTPPTSTRCSRR